MPVVVFSKKLIAASAVTLCVKFLSECDRPGTGPNKSDIFAGSVQERDAFIVEVNASVTRETSTIPSLGFTGQFRNAYMQLPDIIRPGDLLTLSVWKNTDNGLLTGSATNSTEFDAI